MMDLARSIAEIMLGVALICDPHPNRPKIDTYLGICFLIIGITGVLL